MSRSVTAPGPDRPSRADIALLAALSAIAAFFGVATALANAHPGVLAAVAGLGLILVIAVRPAVGAFAWLLLGPLIVGMPRGDGIMVLRPNEGLLLVAVAGIGLRIVWNLARGDLTLPKFRPLDGAVGLLVLTGSILPLLLRYGRGLPVSGDDILYAMVFVKYFIVYALFRFAVTGERDVDLSLKIALGAGVVVGLVALAQVGNVPGVAVFLDRFYDSPFEGAEGPSLLRGSSTIASSFGLADMMTICLAIAIAWLGWRGTHKAILYPAALLFIGGCVAAGSFSGVIGLGVVVLVAGLMTRRLLALLSLIAPTAILAMVAAWPVVEARLAGFESYQGLPRSWIGRLANLERFFWPDVFSGFNWLLGVRPAARVEAPELWRDWVYIESGHTWLLWSGGLPLLLAFLWFFWVIFRDLGYTAARGRGPVRVAAGGAVASAAMIFVLTLFDPHLTVRGTADLFFPLIALAVVAIPGQPPSPATDSRHVSPRLA